MAKSESNKSVVRRLLDAGFTATRKSGGSHIIYKCGKETVSVPVGHKTISPGLQRQVDKAISSV